MPKFKIALVAGRVAAITVHVVRMAMSRIVLFPVMMFVLAGKGAAPSLSLPIGGESRTYKAGLLHLLAVSDIL